MRPLFQKAFQSAKRIPFLKGPLIHIDRVIRQRNEAHALLRESVETLIASDLPDKDLETLLTSSAKLLIYHKLVQRQGIVVHPNGKQRSDLAAKFVRGHGIEIGGLHCPILIPEQASVDYVDSHPYHKLRAGFPYLKDFLLVVPSIVANGEDLEPIRVASVDFVIANHMIEHSVNPIKALFTFAAKLKPEGVAFLAIPDMRATFDRKRKLTTCDHLLQDYESGGSIDHTREIKEFAEKAIGLKGEALAGYLRNFDPKMGDVHYHVWTPRSFRDLLAKCQTLRAWPFATSEVHEFSEEFIVVLRKK